MADGKIGAGPAPVKHLGKANLPLWLVAQHEDFEATVNAELGVKARLTP